ncbi:hypothetical protein BDW22DRAFT_288991 [Trametopsis cervina]|nr:hypothetical protein BDW22DRAFT_288991 [Trametopsis cervina]
MKRKIETNSKRVYYRVHAEERIVLSMLRTAVSKLKGNTFRLSLSAPKLDQGMGIFDIRFLTDSISWHVSGKVQNPLATLSIPTPSPAKDARNDKRTDMCNLSDAQYFQCVHRIHCCAIITAFKPPDDRHTEEHANPRKHKRAQPQDPQLSVRLWLRLREELLSHRGINTVHHRIKGEDAILAHVPDGVSKCDNKRGESACDARSEETCAEICTEYDKFCLHRCRSELWCPHCKEEDPEGNVDERYGGKKESEEDQHPCNYESEHTEECTDRSAETRPALRQFLHPANFYRHMHMHRGRRVHGGHSLGAIGGVWPGVNRVLEESIL